MRFVGKLKLRGFVQVALAARLIPAQVAKNHPGIFLL
jgi:hypothetical protein